MKKYLKIVLALFILILFILSYWLINRLKEKPLEQFPEPKVKLYITERDQVVQLPLEEYLIGTVAGEMPASFELEALKAQAVCARTYAIRKLISSPQYPHNADLSNDIHSCQAYIPSNIYNKWQPELIKKIKLAVTQTRGQIMIFNNQPIDALYHSTCGGQTESALNGWGKEVPYLQSVKCQYCRGTRHYRNVIRITLAQLNNYYSYSKDKNLEIKIIMRTPTGRVKKIRIGSQIISGEKFRQTFNLSSTWFYLQTDGDNLIINSYGYGHGSGMCQYGANGMARTGKTYHDILTTYYHNIQFYRIKY